MYRVRVKVYVNLPKLLTPLKCIDAVFMLTGQNNNRPIFGSVVCHNLSAHAKCSGNSLKWRRLHLRASLDSKVTALEQCQSGQ